MICEEHDSTMCPELIAECPWCRVAQVEASHARLYVQLEKAKAKLEAIHELINTMDWEDHGEVLSVVQHIEKALTDDL